MKNDDESVLGASGRDAQTVEQHPSEAASRARRSNQIPWGYGRDRVTAMAVDPDRLFAYWEVLDESLDQVRAQLGSEAASAYLALRVYDTSGRLFDGTNAHSHFDQAIQREDRQWFCEIGKPTSSTVVEIGLATPSGRFARLARSGRVDFPRREPAQASAVEWMSVRPEGVERAGEATSGANRGHEHGEGVPGGSDAPEVAAHGSAPAESTPSGAADSLRQVEREGGWETVEPAGMDGELVTHLETGDYYTVHREEWVSGPIELPESRWYSESMQSAWQAGPFPYPVEVEAPRREDFVGVSRHYRVGNEARVLFGPWRVVVRGLGAHVGRRVLARWEVHRSWDHVERASAPSASKGRSARGGSELHALSSSELRLRGASEIFYAGASERRLWGASELRFLGATRLLARGASERRFAGASEWRLAGQSEQRFIGASERLRRQGASERRFVGASESAQRLGASERRLGSSELHWVDDQQAFADLPTVDVPKS